MADPDKPVLRYSRTAMVLHWLIAALITVNIVLIWCVDYLPDEAARPVIDTHKSFGITVLGLAIMRLLWRFAHRPPPLPADYPPWEKTAAHAAHIALYVLIFAMPLSGWMHDSAWKDADKFPMKLYALIPWPRIGWIADLDPQTKERMHDLFGMAHTRLSYVLYALFVLHVAAALKHQWIDKHPELERMLPERAKR